jgi:hypothetical protein
MSKKVHKASVNKVFLVKRHLKLEGEADLPWDQIQNEIDQMMGIDEVRMDNEKGFIAVAYDASYKSLSDVEKILDKHSLKIAGNWWTRVKKGWYENTDLNIKENAKHKPTCCH